MVTNRELPWNREGLAPTHRLMAMLDALVDVDRDMGTVTYRRDVEQYNLRCRPYQPVSKLQLNDADTGELFVFGVKELVWAYVNRRLPTGIQMRDETRQARRFAIDNLFQLETPHVAPRYGWSYAHGRLPALVGVIDYNTETALVRILPHNFVVLPEEEFNLNRRKAKVRLMRQLTQSNVILGSYWRAPMDQVGRVTWELMFVQNPHPQYQQAFPERSGEVDPGPGVRILKASDVYTWSTGKATRRKRSAYTQERVQAIKSEEVLREPAVGGRVAKLRQEVAAREKGQVHYYVDRVLFPSKELREFEIDAARAICAGNLVDSDLLIHLSHD